MEANDTENTNPFADLSEKMTAAVEKAAPSVVAIDARPRVATSGIVWREGGVIVSTNHTIRRDENITIGLEDGRTVAATLVGRDTGTDLAVLKIDDREIAKSVKPAETSDASQTKVGNLVLAIGRTSLDGGVTAGFGIVSAVGGAWRTWRGDEIERFISLDLAIRLGFSGGALVNPNGQFLGVNTSAFGRGLALTIPAATVNRVVDVLLTKGKISRPFLGITTQPVPLSDNLRVNLNLSQESGLMILTVETDSPAEKAGVLLGDVLLTLDEKTTGDPRDVQAALWGKEAGDSVKAKILRGGEPKEIEITLGERPAREHNGGGYRGRGRNRCR